MNSIGNKIQVAKNLLYIVMHSDSYDLTRDNVCVLPENEKHKIITKLAESFGLHTFIETGTYRGDTVEAVKSHFDEIYSIEIGEQLAERAKLRFSEQSKIHILHGNSATVLPA